MFNQKVRMQLPFAPGEVWRVSQGNNGSISHKGTAAYSWDWVSSDGVTKGKPIYASAAGEVVDVRTAYFYVKHADDEYCVYMHCITESVKVKVGDQIQMGQQIAEAGDTEAPLGPHLHIALSNVVGLPPDEDGGASGQIFETLPAEFMAYEVWDETAQTWQYVSSGVPQEGQLFRRVSFWNAWEPRGGQFFQWARPSVISRTSNTTDILMRGMDNRLWQLSYIDGWKDWMPHNDGFELYSDPVVDSLYPDNVNVYALGNDNQLWHKFYLGLSWSAWFPLGGQFFQWSRPSAISSRVPNTTEIFMRGMDNYLWQQDGVIGVSYKWTGWMPHNDGFELHSDPAVISINSKSIHVFALGKDDQIWFKVYSDEVGWTVWVPLGGKFFPWTCPTAVSRKSGIIDIEGTNNVSVVVNTIATGSIIDIIMRGMDNRLWQLSYFEGVNPEWTGWIPHNDGFELHSDPVVDSMNSFPLQIFALGKDNQLWQKWWKPVYGL